MQDALEYLALELTENGHFGDYEETFDKLPSNKKDFHIFRYILAAYLNAKDNTSGNNFQNDATLIGGYAIVPHLASQIPDADLVKWRGSHDIDLVTKSWHVKNYLFEGFEIIEDSKSLSLPDKRILGLKNEVDNKPVEVDVYSTGKPEGLGIRIASYKTDKNFWSTSMQRPVFGIGVQVPSIENLLRMKLNVKTKRTDLPREKDMQDIMNLLGVAYHDGIDPHTIIEGLTGEQKRVLGGTLEAYVDSDRSRMITQTLVTPTKKYIQDLDAYRKIE